MTLTRDDITYIKGRLQSAGPAWLRLQLRLALETVEARHMAGGVEVEAREFRDHVFMVTGQKTKKGFDEWYDDSRRPPPAPSFRIPIVADSRLAPGDVILVKRGNPDSVAGRIVNGAWDPDAAVNEDGGYEDRDELRNAVKGELP